jgi:hypothetical protein
MPYPEPPDITNQPDSANIERLLAYLSRLEAVPGDALDALYGLLMRAETAERRLVRQQQRPGNPASDTRTVAMPASRHKAFSRQVALEDVAITCRNCGKTVIVNHYPGTFLPSTCSEQCKVEVQRHDNATRQRRFQERRRTGKDTGR